MEELAEGRDFFKIEKADDNTQENGGQDGRALNHKPVPNPLPLTVNLGPLM